LPFLVSKNSIELGYLRMGFTILNTFLLYQSRLRAGAEWREIQVCENYFAGSIKIIKP
jgi:hypothetical protein